jgi:DNA gyrase subunit B
MEEYTGEGIVVYKSGAIACRARPEMYVGPLDSLQAVSWLLQEALCMAMASAAGGTTQHIKITRGKDHSLSVWDDGPSPVDPQSELGGGLPAYESIMTMLYACREMNKKTQGYEKGKREYCIGGIVTTNALSTWLKLDITWEGQHWHQSYTKGAPDKAIEYVGPSATPWRQISFLPDATIFPIIELHLPTFHSWVAKNSSDLGACKVDWNDLLNNQRLDLRNS